jgi:ribosomal protein S18 acetylase RimI-like enzyme
MDHVLDNPAFNALNTGNKALSKGNEQAKYFPGEISPFSGLAKNTPENFKTLYDVAPINSVFGFITPNEIMMPTPWDILQRMDVLQMVCETPARQVEANEQIVPLGDEHIPAMLDLTKLTNPGPFAQRTIDFGHYCGVFDGDKLVSMAGQRLNPTPYAEISAVCTHPDYLGRGYSALLILNQVHRVKAAGEIPFLHVLSSNTRAINLYQSLGFLTRKEVYIYIINLSSINKRVIFVEKN